MFAIVHVHTAKLRNIIWTHIHTHIYIYIYTYIHAYIDIHNIHISVHSDRKGESRARQ